VVGKSESSVAICLSRLDSLIQSIGRLQKAHASRGTHPSDERSFREIRLAKAAIDADYRVLKTKLDEIRISLADDNQRAKSQRRQMLVEKVFSR